MNTIKEWYGKDIEIINTQIDDENPYIVMKSISKSAKCPCCGKVSNIHHSKKVHYIQDVSTDGLVIIKLVSYQYSCKTYMCSKKVFNERFPFLDNASKRTIMLDQLIIALAYELTTSGVCKVLKQMKYIFSLSTITRLLQKISLEKLSGKNIGEYKYKISDLSIHKTIAYLKIDKGEKFQEWFYGNKKVEIVTVENATIYSTNMIKELGDIDKVRDRNHLLEIFLDSVAKVVTEVNPSYKIMTPDHLSANDLTLHEGKSTGRPFYNYKDGTYVESSSKNKDSTPHTNKSKNSIKK